MNPKVYNNKFAKNMVVIGMSIFGFGLGANIISIFYVESFNDYILADGLRFGLLSLIGAVVGYTGSLIEKKSNEKSV